MMRGLVFLGMLLCAGSVYAGERMCTFAWDEVTTEVDGTTVEKGLEGYRVYSKPTAKGVKTLIKDVKVGELGNALAPSVEIVCDEGTYWVVTAYDEAGNESDDSNQIRVSDNTPPSAPRGFRVEKTVKTTRQSEVTIIETVQVVK